MVNNNRKVVIIEDSEPIRRILGLLLEGHGYDATITGTAAEGLLAIAQQEPAIVVLDLILGTNEPYGFTLVEPIKELGAKVIIVSAYAAQLTPKQRKQVAGVIPKPFGVDELLSLCEKTAPLTGFIGYCQRCEGRIRVDEPYTNVSGRLECDWCHNKRIQAQSGVGA